MAIVFFDDLIDSLKFHPKYKKEFEKEVPAEISLVINFTKKERIIDTNKTIELDTVAGSHIVVDVNEEGVVVSMEIF